MEEKIAYEKSLYQWSANRIGKFPLLRGYGYGKKMLQLAINYVKNNLNASKITLGVFANNDSARYCYESVGFLPVGKTEIYKMPIGEWECIEMEFAPLLLT